MAFGTGERKSNMKADDRLNRGGNNPADDPSKDRARGEEDPSRREERTDNEDMVRIDESETPRAVRQTGNANLDE